MRLSAGRYHSFVVRVWHGDGAGATLRGRVTHVASHQSVGFTDLERMVAFIRDQVIRSAADAPPDGAPGTTALPDVPADGEAPGEDKEPGPGGPP